jgi:hypothetical protein
MKNAPVTSLLLDRLEHIPADSVWAHYASGVRGSLLNLVEQMEDGQQVESTNMNWLISYGFRILEEVAREKVSRRRKSADTTQ